MCHEFTNFLILNGTSKDGRCNSSAYEQQLSSGLVVKQKNVNTEVQGCSPLKHRGWKYFTDSEEAMVEVPSAGAGGCGSQLRGG